jgi:hypothetical protein
MYFVALSDLQISIQFWRTQTDILGSPVHLLPTPQPPSIPGIDSFYAGGQRTVVFFTYKRVLRAPVFFGSIAR